MTNGAFVTVPAAAKAMGVSRIVLERAIKAKALKTLAFYTGSKGAGFRLIPTDLFREWLKGRGGYYETLRNKSTKFHEWGARKNPTTICDRALAVTNGK